ncbi:MAG TPA: hypothetical protein PKA27_05755 [Fimbriimonadaceae bacterium]|nr:hypothetical protein [Fimbriimonadaceae bacterium]
MADNKDVAGTKIVRSIFARRGIDTSRADLRVMHGVAYIRGTVTAIRGSGVTDVKAECEIIARVLRQKPEIRDVVLDCTFRS